MPVLILTWDSCSIPAGQYEKALASAQKALELNPQKTYDHFTRGEVFLAQGRLEESLAEMMREPGAYWSLAGEALVYHASGREQDSNAALTQLNQPISTKHGLSPVAEGDARFGLRRVLQPEISFDATTMLVRKANTFLDRALGGYSRRINEADAALVALERSL